MEITSQLRADQTRIEEALAAYAARWPAYGALRDAMSYSLLSGGKRIRPALTLAVCRLFGGREEDALPFACALEMVQAGDVCVDSDRLIDRQLDNIAISSTAGFARIFSDAAQGVSYTVE